MRRAALYLCYYNITEPLVQTQVVAYLRALARDGVEIHLLTFEKERLDPSQQSRIREELRCEGIEWYSLRYHRWPSLPATLYDITRGAARALRVCARHGIPLVHGRSHVGAAMAWPVKWLRGAKFLFDVRGLLADEYADVGHWSRGGLKYRLTKAIERLLFRQADALVVLTKVIRTDLVASEAVQRHRAPDIQVIPCCAPVERFAVDERLRQVERHRRGWAGRRVLAYVGKLGTWYLVEEMAQFFAVLRQEDSRFFFQVLTQSEPTPMRRALHDAGVPPEDCDIGRVEPGEVPGVLCAADAGISFIRTCYSKRSSSPTKVAEYLAAGLPVVSTRGIGDCDEILGRPNLGVVIERLDDAEYRRAAQVLLRLLDDPETPVRCRQFAEQDLSLTGVGGPRYASVYRRLLADTNGESIAVARRD
jgi:glycosyltransferase involved in cell wall biosynthesis